jgi:AcrR family transcriptional regulator
MKRRKRARSATRIKRNEETRLQLLEAAGRVIGKFGYAGCTIARVTEKAKVAHGTFYLHFDSQQNLFDTVLPVLGQDMLHIIGAAIRDSISLVELERRGFEANFKYLANHPYMYRVLAEAERFAPKAFKQHLDRVVAGYAHSLQRSKFGKQLQNFADDELEAVATMLVGARTYLLLRYGVVNNAVKALPTNMMAVYLKLIQHGLSGRVDPGG